MQKSVEAYLEFCREQGRAPEEPFSGKVVIQTSPELHRRIALEAARCRVSVNTYIQQVLEKGMTSE
jgi:predicted HicB family RNase H-like nuclease